jgi:hypothetical protein
MINGYFDNVAEYVANGRRLKEPSREMLVEYWLGAFTDAARNPADLIARANLNSLASEFHLRGETPPYWRVKKLAQQYIDAVDLSRSCRRSIRPDGKLPIATYTMLSQFIA